MGKSFPSPGDFTNLGTEPGSPALQVDSLPSEPPGEPQYNVQIKIKIIFSIYSL